jgi:hypothetical protein
MKLTSSNQPKATVPPQFRDRVSARIKEANYGLNGKQNRMLTFKCEIVSPDKYLADGQEYILAGQEFSLFPILEDTKVGKMKESFLSAALDFQAKLGKPREFDTDLLEDPNYVNSQYVGLVFDIVMSSTDDVVQRRNPDTGAYEAIIDQATNKPLSRGIKWNPQLSEVLGLSATT